MITNDYEIKKKAAKISLYFGVGMLLAKFTAYYITGSAAIFSDALESIVHIMATTMALYSIIISSRPADDSHLYGYGNIEYFSAGVEGILIIVAAISIIWTSSIDIIKGPELSKLDVGAVIIGFAGLVNLFLGAYLIRIGKKTNSLTLIADGKHVLTDSYTSIGVVIGVVLVIITGFKLLDPAMAIFVAINILYTGYKLIRQSISGLMHETDTDTLNMLTELITTERKQYWLDIHELRFWKSGERLFIDFHLILPYYFNVQKSHAEEQEIQEYLSSKIQSTQIKVHFDYCVPNLCKLCDYADCKVRKQDKSITFSWDKDKLIGKPVYELY